MLYLVVLFATRRTTSGRESYFQTRLTYRLIGMADSLLRFTGTWGFARPFIDIVNLDSNQESQRKGDPN
jgi:hypothetical protein